MYKCVKMRRLFGMTYRITAALRVAVEFNSSELKFMNFTCWTWPVTARV